MTGAFRGRCRIVVLAALLAGACVLAACSGKSAGGSQVSSSSAAQNGRGGSAGAGVGTGGFANGGARPAASGLIAAISGTTMQVQNAQSGQVAVSWTASTRFTDTVSTTLAAIKAGDCATATAITPSTSASAPGAAPSSTPAAVPSGPLSATAVTVSQPVNGQCDAGGFGARTGRTGTPTAFPTRTRPSGAPSGAFAGRAGDFATGTVVSVSGDGFVLAARQFGPASGSAPARANRTVTVTSATRITTTAPSTAKALKVGRCVTAQGSTDSTGAVTATAVRVTDAVNGQCSGGFGGRNG